MKVQVVTSLDAEEDSVERGFRVKVIGLTQESLHFMRGIRNLKISGHHCVLTLPQEIDLLWITGP